MAIFKPTSLRRPQAMADQMRFYVNERLYKAEIKEPKGAASLTSDGAAIIREWSRIRALRLLGIQAAYLWELDRCVGFVFNMWARPSRKNG
jgi:hypothetical protein